MYTVPAYLLALSITLGSISGVSATPLEFTWDCTNSLATCNNYCYAAVCRALFSGTSKFTYDSDKSNAKKRRDQSGCSKNPCNGQSGVSPFNVFGSSCDEFPFASTTQGGAGAILRCVDPTENSSESLSTSHLAETCSLPWHSLSVSSLSSKNAGEGGQLGNFVKSQGLRSGDQYTIFIENYGGARYCATRPSCTNDGGEFRLSGNSFINARRGGSVIARNSSDFEPPDPNAEGPVPLRTFVADDGSTHMMLTDSKEDVIAQGTELFRGAAGSVVKIVEEL